MTHKARGELWKPVRWFLAVGVPALLVGVLAGGVAAAPPTQSADDGETLFQQQCSGCHTIGEGDRAGPDLQGVMDRRDRAWLESWLADPGAMLDQGDPIATQMLDKYGLRMPNLGLSDTQIASLLAYFEAGGAATSGGAATTAGGTSSQASTGTVAALPAGTSVTGKNLFTGTSRFENGGPACRACHSITGIGALGGGALGPSLTGAHQRLGDAMVTWPQNVAPMQAIYSDKPLTEQEKGNLLAFFQAASVKQRPAQAVWQLTGLGIAGVVVLFAIGQAIWRKRLRAVRSPMVPHSPLRS